mmetsp:Transcript_870/g.2578  ORF Transcript_870/g.2578 Transcript_870/m.2578 type:complete len:743 (+) Transcript_870:2502-4730(+)
MSLLDLIEEDHGVWPSADGLGKLSTLVVSHITWWGTNELAHRVPLHELRHVKPHHGFLGSEVVGSKRLRQFRLANTSWSRENERCNRPVGVLQANSCPSDGLRDGNHGLLLADDPVVEGILHLQEPLALVARHLLHWDSSPAGNNVGDVSLSDHRSCLASSLILCLGLVLVLLGDRLDLGLELHLSVPELASLLKVLPPHRGVLLLEKGPELLVELLGLLWKLGVSQPNPRSSLVDQVNRLVGQEPVTDVLVRVLGGSLEGLVSVPELVVHLVPLPESRQNLNGLLDTWLRDVDGLEPSLEGWVLLDMLPVLVNGGGTNALELSSGEGRLEDVGGVDGTLGGTCADERVHLVDHENDVIALLDLLHELLQPLLELSPVLGTGDEQAHVQSNDLLPLDGLRDVSPGDHLRKALGNGSLTHARLTDQARVVLGPPSQDLGDPLDLVGPSDHRVELSFLSLLGQVGAVLLQGWELGVSGGPDSGADLLLLLSHHLDDLGADLRRVCAEVLQDAGGDTLPLTQEAEEQVLRADVVVPEVAGLLETELQNALGPRGERDLHRHEPAAPADDLLHLHAGVLQVHALGLEHLGRDASSLADHAQQQLLRAHEVVPETASLLLRKHNDLDCFFCEPLEHGLGDDPAAPSLPGRGSGRPRRDGRAEESRHALLPSKPRRHVCPQTKARPRHGRRRGSWHGRSRVGPRMDADAAPSLASSFHRRTRLHPSNLSSPSALNTHTHTHTLSLSLC